MKERVSGLVKNQLLVGSAVVFVGSNFVNFLNYIYHLFMGRLLGPVHYGELAALFSMIGLLMMVPGSVTLTIIKFVSANKTHDQTLSVVNWFYRKAYYLSALVFILVLLITPFMGRFLHIDFSWSLLMIPLTLLFGIPTLFNRSILQGLLRFNQSILSVIGENLIKIIVGCSLVYLGFSLSGAIIGVLLSAIIGWSLSLYFLQDSIRSNIKNKEVSYKKVFNFTLPVLVQSIASTSLLSADIVLVKHFFSPHDAGLYAAISTLGKVIFFCSGPIGTVMFPLVSKRHSKNENFYSVLFLSLGITLSIALGIVAGYYLFPDIAIGLLYGTEYLAAKGLLVWFGIFIALYTISSLLTSFFLSLGRTLIFIPTLIAGFIQLIGIWLFHDTLFNVVFVSIISVSFLVVSLITYTIYDYQRSLKV